MATATDQPNLGEPKQGATRTLTSNNVHESTLPSSHVRVNLRTTQSDFPFIHDQKKELQISKEHSAMTSDQKKPGNSPRPIEPSNLQGLPSSTSTEVFSNAYSSDENLLKQVGAWLKRERVRRHARKAKRKGTKVEPHEHGHSKTTHKEHSNHLTISQDNDGLESSDDESAALDQLAHILEKGLAQKPVETKKRIQNIRRQSLGLKRHSAISLDSDHFDLEQMYPDCDVILDNSKTMAYNTDKDPDQQGSAEVEKLERAEKEAWLQFRYEILRLTHTLKLKSWRMIPLEASDGIKVQRLSGALTNAVYMVSPPKNVPGQNESGDGTPRLKKPPIKLLLRIYGPQVGHLIDRETELSICPRLARKGIGPRILGTFQNGRFEEFLNAKALTSEDLRVPDTSTQIAKRMRELHDGMDLLKSEREAGPFVWQNWDKWLDRCEKICTWLDQQIKNRPTPSQADDTNLWKSRGFVCGTEWVVFRSMIEKYRVWLEKQYGGIEEIKERMVFAHNDAQYGNILRMEPESESPLLLPANQHKQLVVIDFEYANANLPGLEFANHFTEWCYNYHHPDAPWRCRTQYYPNPEQQHRFIQAYLLYMPAYKMSGSFAANSMTPRSGAISLPGSTTTLAASTGNLTGFMLDARVPPGEKYADQEAEREKKIEDEVKRLMAEAKLWRLANSAMWVAWGIVQANIPGMPTFADHEPPNPSDASDASAPSAPSTTTAESDLEKYRSPTNRLPEEKLDHVKKVEGVAAEKEEEEFDYLSYANDRALFLWGDALELGIVGEEELGEELRERVMRLNY